MRIYVPCCRSNNVLELWDVKHTPHLDRVFTVGKDDSIESIAWCNERLFSAGLGGSVLEHDVLTTTVTVSVVFTLEVFLHSW